LEVEEDHWLENTNTARVAIFTQIRQSDHKSPLHHSHINLKRGRLQ
jgi:hypothetical protein